MIQDTIVYLKNAGRMDKSLIYVEDNVYHIPRRLRQEVNPEFVVMFNPNTQRYEIHVLRHQDQTLELILPYDELDARAITHALYARDIERVRKEIEENNAQIDEAKRKALEDERKWKTKELFDYCNRHMDKETWDDGAYGTRWV
jgi:hypothetical protein